MPRFSHDKRALASSAGGDHDLHGPEYGSRADEELARELEKSLDLASETSDNIDIRFLGNESPSERRKKIHEFLHQHDRVTLPACADCQRECKLKAPAGAEITLICRDWVPVGETK